MSCYIDCLEGFDFYEIVVDYIILISFSICILIVVLIDRDYELNNFVGRLLYFFLFLIVLEWSVIYLLVIYYMRDYVNFSCFNGIVNFCFCNFFYEGNFYFFDGC